MLKRNRINRDQIEIFSIEDCVLGDMYESEKAGKLEVEEERECLTFY